MKGRIITIVAILVVLGAMSWGGLRVVKLASATATVP